MRPAYKWLFYVFMLTTSVMALAAESFALDLSAGIGFYSLDNTRFPEAVRQSAASVFKVRVPDFADSYALRDFDISTPAQRKVAEEAIANYPLTNRFDELDRVMSRAQLQNCLSHAQKHCSITLGRIQGTGFITDDGAAFWTNAHIVRPYLVWMESASGNPIAAKEPVPVFIFDGSGTLIVDPYKSAVRIKTLPSHSSTTSGDGEIDSYDYVVLRLSRSIGKPLAFAKPQVSRVGEAAFVVGYPHCTGCDFSGLKLNNPDDAFEFTDRSPEPNSDGRGLEGTAGEVLDVGSLSEFFGKQLSQQGMVYVSADATFDNSGSPIFDAKGKVLAILADVRTKNIHHQLQHVSLGVIPR